MNLPLTVLFYEINIHNSVVYLFYINTLAKYLPDGVSLGGDREVVGGGGGVSGAGSASFADSITNESVRLVSDLLVRRPPSTMSTLVVGPSREPDSLESPILPPPVKLQNTIP